MRRWIATAAVAVRAGNPRPEWAQWDTRRQTVVRIQLALERQHAVSIRGIYLVSIQRNRKQIESAQRPELPDKNLKDGNNR